MYFKRNPYNQKPRDQAEEIFVKFYKKKGEQNKKRDNLLLFATIKVQGSSTKKRMTEFATLKIP